MFRKPKRWYDRCVQFQILIFTLNLSINVHFNFPSILQWKKQHRTMRKRWKIIRFLLLLKCEKRGIKNWRVDPKNPFARPHHHERGGGENETTSECGFYDRPLYVVGEFNSKVFKLMTIITSHLLAWSTLHSQLLTFIDPVRSLAHKLIDGWLISLARIEIMQTGEMERWAGVDIIRVKINLLIMAHNELDKQLPNHHRIVSSVGIIWKFKIKIGALDDGVNDEIVVWRNDDDHHWAYVSHN